MDCLFTKFTFVIKHKSSQYNEVVNALNRRASLLATISTEVVGFDYLKDTYADDEDFGAIWAGCNNNEFVTDFLIQDEFLFRGIQLCIPCSFFVWTFD